MKGITIYGICFCSVVTVGLAYGAVQSFSGGALVGCLTAVACAGAAAIVPLAVALRKLT